MIRSYMVAGGFAVAGNRIAEIEDAIATLRDDAGIRSEFHWSAYRGGEKRRAYESLIRYAFSLINKRHAAFHVIVARFEGYDHKANAGENRDTSINRMYYQLLLHKVAALYGRKRAIHVRLDAGNDCKDVCSLRGAICAAAYSTYNARPNCVKTIEPLDSTRSGLIQMADVLLGAIAAKRNMVVHAGAKGELADFVLKASGRHSWDVNTPSGSNFLSVWQHATAVGPPHT